MGKKEESVKHNYYSKVKMLPGTECWLLSGHVLAPIGMSNSHTFPLFLSEKLPNNI